MQPAPFSIKKTIIQKGTGRLTTQIGGSSEKKSSVLAKRKARRASVQKEASEKVNKLMISVDRRKIFEPETVPMGDKKVVSNNSFSNALTFSMAMGIKSEKRRGALANRIIEEWKKENISGYLT